MFDLDQFRAKIAANEAPFNNFFGGGELFFGRAPGRLDVMGGIADYSGALVLEMPLAEATLAAVQLTHEPVVKIRSLSAKRSGRSAECQIPLKTINSHSQFENYQTTQQFFKESNQPWSAYIGGVFCVLANEKGFTFEQGARILLHSEVPEGKGVSSSAAVEVATMQAVARAYNIPLDPDELARLCQKVENEIVGAPCGIMDQMTVVSGRADELMALLCQPATILGHVPVPPQYAFWGLDSGIQHAVSDINAVGATYRSVRVGAFMGLKILQTLMERGLDGYLVNMPPSEFEQNYREKLPIWLSGSDFLDRYGELPDPITTVEPNHVYAVRQPTAHPIYEHVRVQTFARLLADAAYDNAELLGELMYQSHASYSACGLGSDGTDLLVHLVREAGAERGLFGAKITGGGSGGTVAILGRSDATEAIAWVSAEYHNRTGHQPYLFTGSSPGAKQTS